MLAFTLGLHWVFLQSFAWVNMAAGDSVEGSFLAAIKKAMDTRTSCGLCRVISAGKKAEKDVPANLVPLELDGVAVDQSIVVSWLNTHSLSRSTPTALSSRAHGPPTPPPCILG
ncbi:MAG: hypothetical protein CMO66_02095 [Verrucomicrobiales bacterium]|nr:hypothetical protein [Verrucomicrobiales bacterium]